jgi:hypothetical protein
MDIMGTQLSKKTVLRSYNIIKNNKNLTTALLIYKLTKYRLLVQYK